jgi:tRNA A37 threonylcarbamoyladenosine biosynthesis protein TsaE
VPLLADCYQPREEQTAELDESINNTVVLTRVLSGLGGAGKTQLAAGYARRVWASWVVGDHQPIMARRV